MNKHDKVSRILPSGEIVETAFTWEDMERISLHHVIQKGKPPMMEQKDWEEYIEKQKQQCGYNEKDFMQTDMKNPRSWRPEEIKIGMFFTHCCLHDAARIDETNIDYVKSELGDVDEIYIDVYETLKELIENTKGCGVTIKDRPDLQKYL